MHLQLPLILAVIPLILAAPTANHEKISSDTLTDTPTRTLPTRADVSILPVPNPPAPASTPSLADLVAFCASGSVAANLPAVRQFCTIISGIANTAGGIGGGALPGGLGGGLGGGIGGIIPPVPGVPVIPGLGGGGSGGGILPGGLGPAIA